MINYSDYAAARGFPARVEAYDELIDLLSEKVQGLTLVDPTDMIVCDENTWLPGVYAIVGEPRSGKSTLAHNVMDSLFDGTYEYMSLNEPLSVKNLKIKDNYGARDFKNGLDSFIKSSKFALSIDSIRTLIHSLGGPLMAGGISVNYKDVLTALDNIAIRLRRCIFLVLTTDADILKDVLGSCQCMVYISEWAYTFQYRDGRFAGYMPEDEDLAGYKPIDFTLSDGAIETNVEYKKFNKARLYRATIISDALAGSELAIQALRERWSTKKYEYMATRKDNANGVPTAVIPNMSVLGDVDTGDENDYL